jgi:hypothetical protein
LLLVRRFSFGDDPGMGFNKRKMKAQRAPQSPRRKRPPSRPPHPGRGRTVSSGNNRDAPKKLAPRI